MQPWKLRITPSQLYTAKFHRRFIHPYPKGGVGEDVAANPGTGAANILSQVDQLLVDKHTFALRLESREALGLISLGPFAPEC